MPAVRRALLLAVLWLFFFNALLDRVASYYFGVAFFTDLFYLSLGLGIALRCGLTFHRGRASWQTATAGVFLVVALGLGLVYGDPLASVYGIKQFFLGVLFLVLFAGDTFPVTALVRGLLLVQLYAAFQGVYFWIRGFTLPPWDGAYVASLLQSWQARNLYQGDLIRPFATFASFSEYQIVVHVLTVGVFLLRRRLAPTDRRVAWALMGALLFVDALLPDRTPIFMAAIALATTWLGEYLLLAARVSPRRLLLGFGLVAVITIAVFAVPAVVRESANPGLRRLGEGFRFWQAETVLERAATVWSDALYTIRTHPEGAGPAMVATGLYPDAFTPHSNYFLLAIAYSVAFPAVFLGFLGLSFWPTFRAAGSRTPWRARAGFCGWGVTLAYLASSFFNAPFSGYPGGAYFLLMLWLTSILEEPAPHATTGLVAQGPAPSHIG